MSIASRISIVILFAILFAVIGLAATTFSSTPTVKESGPGGCCPVNVG